MGLFLYPLELDLGGFLNVKKIAASDERAGLGGKTGGMFHRQPVLLAIVGKPDVIFVFVFEFAFCHHTPSFGKIRALKSVRTSQATAGNKDPTLEA